MEATTSRPTAPISPAHILNRMGQEFRNEIDRLKAIEAIVLSHPEWVQSDPRLQELIHGKQSTAA